MKRDYGFRTGGYTGEWGNEGKLAVLHEKELVLNKEDTSNLLNAMTFLNDIVKTIDLSAQSASTGLGALVNATHNASLGQLSEAFEQNVTINADFPSATDHSEIEQAFNNLLNTASQYAGRKL